MEHQLLKIREGSVFEALSSSDILEEHWNELVKRKHLLKVNPHNEVYKCLEDNGQLFTLIAECDNKMVGYSVNTLTPHLHYMDVMVCANDLLFVLKEYRNSPLGIKLIKETEKLARERGAQVMTWHAKPNTPLDKILPRLSNNLHEHIYTKEL